LNYYGIWFLKAIGLAKDVKVTDLPEKLREQAEKLAGAKLPAAAAVPVAAKPDLVSA
jgi:hypothetical protein